jgi:replicative DNA helicase
VFERRVVTNGEVWHKHGGAGVTLAEFPHAVPDDPYERRGEGRTPPQDEHAEQSVLGAMLLSKDAIADVVEVLHGADFYRPANELIFDAILDLYGRGEPADAVTVSAELTRRGSIAQAGGAPYLHTLSAAVPVAANAAYYAEIVRETSILRRLIGAGTRIVQSGYAAEGQVDDVVDRAQAEIYAVSERRAAEDYAPLSELMEATIDELEAIGNRDGQLSGVPTGFAELDALTNGLHPGQMVIIAARPAIGKALALDTPLPTPAGWTTMGEVKVGDQLYDAAGRPTTVVAATDVMVDRPCYKVVFSDGTTIVADAQHQWLTETRSCRKSRSAAQHNHRTKNQRTFASVLTTQQIASTARVGSDKRANHAVCNAAALTGPTTALPIPAYVLGAWLGDGHSGQARITSDADEIAMYIEGYGIRCEARGRMLHSLRLRDNGSFMALLRDLGVLNAKHIPASYLRAPEASRRELLAGMLDTDGTVVRSVGSVQLALTNKRLADDVYELIVSLGYRCGRRTKQVRGRNADSSPCHVLNFSTVDDVFRLHRKAVLHKETRPTSTARIGRRYIVDVRPVESVPVRCVEVDNADHLYLATRAMIPTHNSTIGLDIARAASIKHGLTSAIFSLEMSRTEITMRLLSAEAKIRLKNMRDGTMSDDDWQRLVRKMGEVSEAPLFIDDSPNLTMMEIRAKARRLRQRHDLRLIVIDYMQLMTSGRKVESRQLEVSEFSRQIKLLAKELEIPVIAISQLNRGAEQRTDKQPQLADLRESGCVTADTTLLRADTGAPVTFRELLAGGHAGCTVWSLDDQRKMVPALVTKVFPSGVRAVSRLRLASGREVKATGNHRFLTFRGWVPLDQLAVGDRLAIPRRVPASLGSGLGWSEHRLGLLAHLIGDGCVLRSQPVHYTSGDEANLAFVEAAAAAEFGITPRRVAQQNWWHTYLPAPYRCTQGRYNPLRSWFRELGIDNRRAAEKRIPDVLYSASDHEAAIFLRHLWATNGSVVIPSAGSTTTPRVYYASSSRALADGVAVLLSRFGIVARVREVQKVGYRAGYHVDVADGPSMREFCLRIGVDGRRGEIARRLLGAIEHQSVNTNVDTLPIESWEMVKAERARVGMTEREFQSSIGTHYCGSALYKSCPSRSQMLRCADALGSELLRSVATDDVFWDRVIEIEPLGTQPVYDATVKGTHNFIADGIVAHNSLEQDADMVILLHRDDAYERDPNLHTGVADINVAKHRNGPTKKLELAFQGHFSRFTDLADG